MKEKDRIIFDPRFGKNPSRLVGRDDVLRDISFSLDDPYELKPVMVFSGIKGSGKTAILSDIRTRLDTSRTLNIDIGDIGSVKEGLTVKNDASTENDLVCFIDDAEKDIDGLRDFLIRFFGEDEYVDCHKIFIAGLPHAVQELLKEKELSFVKKSQLITLKNIRTDEVLSLFTEAFPAASGANAERAAEATLGYPYLIQLIGYYLSKEENNLDEKAVERAVFRSKIELYKNVHEPAVWSLSSKDRMFLWSMSQDEGPSEFGEIAKRMNVSAGYASKYRERLISADVIYRSAYGELSFAFPYMKEYIEKEYIERFGGERGKRRL